MRFKKYSAFSKGVACWWKEATVSSPAAAFYTSCSFQTKLKNSQKKQFGASDPSQNGTCAGIIEMETFLHYSLVPSAIIIIIMACLEKRARRCCLDEKLPSLSGCVGMLTPFDFVSSFNNRWSLGFAFGVTADKVMYLFTQDYFPEGLPDWATVFWVLLIAVEVGISSYPFFVCLSASYMMTGATLGFLYTAAWLTVMVIDIAQCPEEDVVGGYSTFILVWPSLVCQLFLLGQFFVIFVEALRVRCGLEPVNEEASFMEGHQAQYVQHLLRKPPLEPAQKSWIWRKLYEWDPYFKFPSRIISTVVLVIICLYMFAAAEFIVGEILILYLPISLNETDLFSSLEEFCNVAEGKDMILGYSKSKIMLVCDRDTLACEEKVALGKFISCEVAYTVWGYLIIHLLQWVFGMIVMYILILPMKRGEWMELLNKWGTVILSFIIITVIGKVELIAVARIFLQPKILPKDKQKPLALGNRKAFMNFSYFLFFHSVVVGLMSCLKRLFYSIILGAWLVGRIDRPVMPMGFESFDSGFSIWVQMLFLDHYHTNPVLVCFCHILDSANRKRKRQRVTVDVAIIEPTGTDFRVSHKAKTRWLVLYTLLNNPGLQRIRKSRPEFQGAELAA
ncbi:stimulated by retinoic acid gene 6 protein-like [Elgaria multicarinata webbii]|uniref:stimulated by retinoic acid gene 6 protein-like n=1 Tax=Elgaria multicarinata webbii TaxID=159646 RepID=UPI002FCCEA90